jgi:hypothetical protein
MVDFAQQAVPITTIIGTESQFSVGKPTGDKGIEKNRKPQGSFYRRLQG